MIVLEGFAETSICRGGVLTIGNFDGVHSGHRRMLSVLVERAKALAVPSAVLTFDPPPVQLLRPDAVPPRLSTLETKTKLIEQCGVDFLIIYPTDVALLNLEPEEFFTQIVIETLSARGMVEGPNFCFGRKRRGNVELLAQLCQASGCSLDVIEPELDGEDWISSSNIRSLIAQGDLNRAVRMLGHPYRMEGLVVKGAGRGRQLGFPTANLEGVETLIPGNGVYAGWGIVENTRYPAAVHIGSNPTFGEDQRKLEVHLLDLDRDLYGQQLAVELLARVRGMKVFPNAEELQAQIESDLVAVRRLANLNNAR